MIKNKKRIIILFSWILTIIWMLFIFFLSSQVAEESNNLSTSVTIVIAETVERIAPEADFDIRSFNNIIRKNAHFLAYFVLGVLVMNSLRSSGIKGLRGGVLSLIICLLYAVSDEIHQLFVSGRGGQAKDVLIDSAGAVVGIVIYWTLSRIFRYT